MYRNTNKKIYRAVTLPVVLYGCRTWSLTLKGNHKLRVCENRVPRKLVRPKWEEVTGDWRISQNKEAYHWHFLN